MIPSINNIMNKRTVVTAIFILCALGLLTIAIYSKRRDRIVSASAGTAVSDVSDSSDLQCIQRGVASWYGTNMKGRITASGEEYDPEALTAASRIFPFGTEVNVINLKNDRNVTVTVNDRGPYFDKRIIDMSVAAAHELDMEKDGLADVCVQNMEQAAARADSDIGAHK